MERRGIGHCCALDAGCDLRGQPGAGLQRRRVSSVREGNIVGYQGVGQDGPIYQTIVNGQPQRIAITVANNDYMVGANPAGRVK